MTSGFSLKVQAVDAVTGRMEGAGLDSLARFLLIAEGIAVFDVEYDGQLFYRCRLDGAVTDDALLFTYEELVAVETFRSDPNASPE